jgi:hypothetical protein
MLFRLLPEYDVLVVPCLLAPLRVVQLSLVLDEHFTNDFLPRNNLVSLLVRLLDFLVAVIDRRVLNHDDRV